ncbi:tryptophan-rich sensory protein [Staphylococcus succinus]|uniref:Tryptophan-rich sensory protein n=1 Tax=Staphylococcus succinus TaxID=61015 RepID=A0A9Q6HPP9_9STAP|nr:tryptophan-rich sensory protein [Staphylococcus succinus]PTI75819.1 tryptophan-rich sensory protein [Staphylococcus succinus]PTJ21073.1 tryptophan-rich sensory protein [Staphylococcus succinus]RIN29150.1 tryptophan-rich sensory protein [Staphylococcus succinus]RIN33327.1 tryptophan-rich sensory protein [Staphylococcus succinus]
MSNTKERVILSIITNIFRITLPLIGGKLIGAYAVKNARADLRKTKKPPFSPPGYVFPIVWSILYTCMGIAYTLAKNTQNNTSHITSAHYTQLGLNYLWSLLYFKFKLRGFALIESYMLLLSVIVMCMKFFKAHKLSGLIMIPYVLWSTFASYLTTGNWFLNKDNPDYH